MEAAELKQIAEDALAASLEADAQKPAHARLGEKKIRDEKLIELVAGDVATLAENLPDRVARALYVGNALLEPNRQVFVKASDVAHVAALRLKADAPAAKKQPAQSEKQAEKPAK